ncbi:MAG TPA: amino acid permease [Burkholderiales bacterium]|nr:amino acid permease [Burkholderiales bacterium]
MGYTPARRIFAHRIFENHTLPMTTPASGHEGTPQRVLSTIDAVAIIVGLVIGAGIFRLPSLVAGNSSGEAAFYLLWAVGGIISLIGALCYAELATAYPSAGGDYHFLRRAFGRGLSFLFAWARIAVITTGSIAVLGYTFGDYASNLFRLGANSSAIYAALSVIVLTAVNISGIRETKGTQNVLTVIEVAGVVAVILTGILLVAPASAPAASAEAKPFMAGAPLAILFVLFTFGGWNEGAYISAELKERRSMVTALAVSLITVTVLYLLVNFAYVRALGLEGVAKSETVAADVLRLEFGETGFKIISFMIAVSALTSINATIIVGARSNYALGRDWRVFAWLGHWDARGDAPRNALLVQATVALALVIAGAFTAKIETMVDYTMPVFWFFFMLVGIGLFVLRVRDPDAPRPFKVPLYPVTPLIFVATCAYLLYSSLAYVRTGAWVGVGVLAVGGVLLAVNLRLGSPALKRT